MLSPARTLVVGILILTGLLAFHATRASAAPAGRAIPHADCSYPGAPDCNMGGGSSGSGGCGMSCGGSTSGVTSGGSCINVTGIPSIIPQVSPIGCGSSSSPAPQSSNPSCAYFSYTCNTSSTGPSPTTNSTTNISNTTNSASGSCPAGQVPGNSIGIATTLCVTQPSGGGLQSQPQPQSTPTPIPTPVQRTSCTDGTTTTATTCPTTCTDGTTTANTTCPTTCSDGTTTAKATCPTSCTDGTTTAKSACPTSCTDGTTTARTTCATSCTDGTTTANSTCSTCAHGTSATQAGCKACPGGVSGTYSGPDPVAAGCPPAPTTSANTTTTTTSTCGPSTCATCGGTSLMLPSMDLRVGGVFPGCIDCHLSDGSVKHESVGDCVLDGGSWDTSASSGGSSSSSSGGGGGSGSGAPSLPQDLDTSPGKPYDTCNTLINGGAGLSAMFGSARAPSSVAFANALQSGGSDFCATLASSPHPGLDSNAWMACLNAAIFPEFTHNASYTALSPGDAAAACLNIVPPTSGH
jgi:hypothetical protein